MKYAEYSKDLKKYKTARENAYYDEKDDGTLVTCGNAVDKLGLYEDIDESPEHLAKIKQALEIIKKKRVDINVLIVSKNVDEYNKVRFILLKAGSSFWKLTQEEYDLLKEVLL